MSEQATKKKKPIKKIIQSLFLIVLTGLGIYYVLKDDPERTFACLAQASLFPVLVAIFALLLSIIIEGASLTILTRTKEKNYHLFQGSFVVAGGGVIGCFLKQASPIFQSDIYKRQGIKAEESASYITINYLVYQASLVVYIIVVVILGYSQMKDVRLDVLGNIPITWVAFFGLFMQSSFLVIITTLSMNKWVHRFVSTTCVNFLGKIHLLKHPVETRKKLTLRFLTYRLEMKKMFKLKGRVTVCFLLHLVKQFVLGIIPYIVIWSLVDDITKVSFFSSFVGAGYVSTISSFLTVGAPEVTFQTIFSSILSTATDAPSSVASATNIIWRFLTFYFIFFIGLFTVLFYQGKREKKRYTFASDSQTIYDLNILLEDEKAKGLYDEIKTDVIPKEEKTDTEQDGNWIEETKKDLKIVYNETDELKKKGVVLKEEATVGKQKEMSSRKLKKAERELRKMQLDGQIIVKDGSRSVPEQ